MKLAALVVASLCGMAPHTRAQCATAPTKAPTSFFLQIGPDTAKGTRTVRLCLVSAKELGSYLAHISFDSTQMRVVRVDARNGLQAVNSTVPGEVRIAGAAPSGFPNGVLAEIDFKVGRGKIEPMALAVSEATTTAGASLVKEIAVSGWPRASAAPTKPTIDSISPRSGELDDERVTDITIYGRGFAARGNVVLFGAREVPGLMSERGGTVLRFSAPPVRVTSRQVAIRVKHDGFVSNAVTFTVKEGER